MASSREKLIRFLFFFMSRLAFVKYEYVVETVMALWLIDSAIDKIILW